MDPAVPLIGHAPQRAQLESDIETGNVTHAYLFAGPPSVGKFTLAKEFGIRLLQRAAPEDRRDDVAVRARKLIHPDFLVMDKLWMEEKQEDWDELAKFSNVPQRHRGKSPKIMKTDVISIDDVRALQERLYDTGETPVRVCCIRSVERMRDEAANAFLKILEEPPPGRVFLLTAASAERLLPTILSRTRILRFGAVPLPQIAQLLGDIPEDDRAFLLHVCRGAPGVALRLLRDPDLLRAERQLHTSAIAFWNERSLHRRLRTLAPLHERGEEADRLLFHLWLALRGHPRAGTRAFEPLARLTRDLQTNAHRQLLAQRFGMDVSGS